MTSSVILSTMVAEELGKDEEWASDAKLFQPFDVEQILLPDNANCIAVQTFLKMCKLPFTVAQRKNAEFMSPSGKIPFLKCGSFIIAELDPIVQFAANKGISLTEHLDSKQRSDMRADMSLINNVLANAELYLTWVEPYALNQITQPRYASVYPFPLDTILTYQKRCSIHSKLKALNWLNKKVSEVYSEVDKVCRNLSSRLGTNQYFFARPSELDALVFGHVYSIVTTQLPDKCFADIIRGYPNLISHCERINSQYTTRPPSM